MKNLWIAVRVIFMVPLIVAVYLARNQPHWIALDTAFMLLNVLGYIEHVVESYVKERAAL